MHLHIHMRMHMHTSMSGRRSRELSLPRTRRGAPKRRQGNGVVAPPKAERHAVGIEGVREVRRAGWGGGRRGGEQIESEVEVEKRRARQRDAHARAAP